MPSWSWNETDPNTKPRLLQHKHSAVIWSPSSCFWSAKLSIGIYIHPNTTLSSQCISAVRAPEMLSRAEQMQFPLFYFSRLFHLWPALSAHWEENRKCCDIYLTAYVSSCYLCRWRTALYMFRTAGNIKRIYNKPRPEQRRRDEQWRTKCLRITINSCADKWRDIVFQMRDDIAYLLGYTVVLSLSSHKGSHRTKRLNILLCYLFLFVFLFFFPQFANLDQG